MHFDKTQGISQLTQALLRQIENQRNGDEVDQTLMKGIVQSYGKLPMLQRGTELTGSIARHR